MVGRSGLGRDGAAEDEGSDGGAEREGVSDVAQQEPGGDARGVEVTDDDSEKVDEDSFASSSEESDAMPDPRFSQKKNWCTELCLQQLVPHIVPFTGKLWPAC
jgi:hypothetical protein